MPDCNCQPLKPIIAGADIPFKFTFKDSSGDPITDLSGEMHFTAKVNPGSSSLGSHDITHSEKIATDNNGSSGMIVPRSKTINLTPSADMIYEFMLLDDRDDTLVPMGGGRFTVSPMLKPYSE